MAKGSCAHPTVAAVPPSSPEPTRPRFVPGVNPPRGVRPGGGGDRFVHVVGTSVFVSDRLEDDGGAIHFLGTLDGAPWWAVDVAAGTDPSSGAAVDLYSLFGRTSEVEWLVAGRAVQLAEWARTHRFCGRCGTPTEQQLDDRAMRCPACGLLAYPRVAPAMITLVTRGEPGPDEEALLACGVQFRAPLYSCLAGFVEPGERLEDAVVREVEEEVGVVVGDVTYRGSQPWPFPHSLMIGFRARWRSGEIECDPTEIVDAGWYRRDALPAIPPHISIARRLIDEWVAES